MPRRLQNHRRCSLSFARFVLLVASVVPILSHPGSGIVVDRAGCIYFTDTGQGIWKIDQDGETSADEGPPYRWMTLDPEGRFRESGWPDFVGPPPVLR